MAVSERTKNARNIAIVLAIAAAVDFIPGGGRAAATVEAALLVAFGVAIGYLGLRFYREAHMSLFSIGDRYRGILYGSLALAFFAYAVRSRLWYALEVQGGALVQVHRWDGFGEALWFVMVGLVVYGLLTVYRRWRAY